MPKLKVAKWQILPNLVPLSKKLTQQKTFLEGRRVGGREGPRLVKKGKTMKHEKSKNDPKDNQLWCHNIQQNDTNNSQRRDTQNRSYKYCD